MPVIATATSTPARLERSFGHCQRHLLAYSAVGEQQLFGYAQKFGLGPVAVSDKPPVQVIRRAGN